METNLNRLEWDGARDGDKKNMFYKFIALK